MYNLQDSIFLQFAISLLYFAIISNRRYLTICLLIYKSICFSVLVIINC